MTDDIDTEDLDESAKARVEALLAKPQPDRDAETVDGELEEPE